MTDTFENLLRVVALFMKRIHIFTYMHNLGYGFKPILVDMCLRTLL